MQRVGMNNVQSHSWRVASHTLFLPLDFMKREETQRSDRSSGFRDFSFSYFMPLPLCAFVPT